MSQNQRNRSVDVAKSMPDINISDYLASHLVPLPIFKRKIEFLKNLTSEKYQTKKQTDMPTFSGITDLTLRSSFV